MPDGDPLGIVSSTDQCLQPVQDSPLGGRGWGSAHSLNLLSCEGAPQDDQGGPKKGKAELVCSCPTFVGWPTMSIVRR